MTAQIRKEMALKEIAVKQKAADLRWFKKYYTRIYGAESGLVPSEVPRKASQLFNEMVRWDMEMKASKEKQLIQMRTEQAKPQERRWKPSVVTKWDLERGTMYPVEPEIRAVLYDGISHNDEGRRRYLYIRNQEEPCDKFYEPQAPGMDYGWNVTERAFPPNKQFASAQIINSEFYRRSGIKGDTLRNRQALPISLVTPEQL